MPTLWLGAQQRRPLVLQLRKCLEHLRHQWRVPGMLEAVDLDTMPLVYPLVVALGLVYTLTRRTRGAPRGWGGVYPGNSRPSRFRRTDLFSKNLSSEIFPTNFSLRAMFQFTRARVYESTRPLPRPGTLTP
jgi:hypothetical protein